MRAVIAHCWTGSPDIGWYPAAAAALRALAYEVVVPTLPNTDAPEPGDWIQALQSSIGTETDELLLVGHSLGAVAVLHWLSLAPPSTRVAGVFLVAPPLQSTGIPEVDRFLSPGPDLAGAARRAAKSAVLVSDADTYLKPDPETVSQSLVDLGFERLVAPGRGHFSPASGLTSLPQLTAWAARLAQTAP